MSKNLSKDEYYEALTNAIYIATASLNLRKDTATRLLLGGMSGGAIEIAQTTNMNYETVLKT
jgi:hypothetical protein